MPGRRALTKTRTQAGSRGGGCLLRAFAIVLGLSLMAGGSALFLWPSFTAWQSQREMTKSIDSVLVREADSPEEAFRSKDGDPAYEYLARYNRNVAEGNGGAINDPFGIGTDEIELSEVGLEDAIVGSVTIPSMNVQLPVYLGATSAHMELGAAVISGTSAPLGGASSNCVLAAHRGERYGVPMFRDIESVRVGDLVIMETPWDVLVYRAAELKVISPSDAKSISVQPGRDLVTLFSCHPYGANYQRYLVICERDLEAERAYLQNADMRSEVAGATSPLSILTSDVKRVTEPCDSFELRAERVLRVVGLALFVVSLLVVVRVAVKAFPHHKDSEPQHERPQHATHFRS